MFDELSEHFNPSKYTPLNAPKRVRRMWAHRAHQSHRKNLRKNLTACQGMLQDMVDSAAAHSRNPVTKDGYSYSLKKVDGEYIVRFHKDGKWLGEGPTYYTDDKQDALGTAEHMLQQYRQREVARNPELLVWRNPGRRSTGLSVRGLSVKRRKSKMRKRRKKSRSRRRARNGKMYIKVGGKKLTWRGVVRKYGIKKGARRWKKSSKFHGGKRVTRSCRRKSRR